MRSGAEVRTYVGHTGGVTAVKVRCTDPRVMNVARMHAGKNVCMDVYVRECI